MNCPQCGKNIKENAAFCVFCGFRISEGSFSIPSTSPRNDGNTQAQVTQHMPGASAGQKMFNNRYSIEKEIGRGGMGRVFLALDTKMDGRVVIKEMLPQSADTANREYMEKRFIEEAKLLFNLKHPGLPGVLDYFVEGTSLCLVMEYINGKNLEQIQEECKHGQVGIKEGVGWMIQIIGILSFLHNQNPPVVHRDIKPANILLTGEGKIYLVDFGVARTLGLQSHTQTAVGTYGYASPEHYSGKFTLSSDIYSLGATFHHLFSGDSPQENEPFRFTPLSRYRTDIPADLDEIIIKMTKQERTERYGKIEEVMRDLKNISYNAASKAKASVRVSEKPDIVTPASAKSTRIAFSEEMPGAMIPSEEKALRRKKKKEDNEKKEKQKTITIAAVVIALLAIFGFWHLMGAGGKNNGKSDKGVNVSQVAPAKKKVAEPTEAPIPSPSLTASATPTLSPSPSPSTEEVSPTPEDPGLAEFSEETHPQANEGFFIECGRYDKLETALTTAKRLKSNQFKPTIGKEDGWFVVYAVNSSDPQVIAEDYDRLKKDSFDPVITTYRSGGKEIVDRNSSEFQPAAPPPQQTPAPVPTGEKESKPEAAPGEV
jgi:serine/threonine protein kinase